MRANSNQDLAAIRKRVLELADLVVTAIREATDAFNSGDAALAANAVASGLRITALADELDELVIDVPPHEPVSPRDVKDLMRYGRTTVRLARMGDFARHIALAAQRHSPNRIAPDELHASFVQMSAQAVDAAELVTRLMRTHDLELAAAIAEDDQWLDVLQQRAFAAVNAPDWAGGPARAVDVILTARYLERFGDLAVFIARRIAAPYADEDAATETSEPGSPDAD